MFIFNQTQKLNSFDKPMSEQNQGLFYRIHLDFPLLMGLVVLCLFGLIILYSASGQSLAKVEGQGIRLCMGFIAMMVIAQFSPQIIRRWSPPVYIIGVLLLLAVLITGDIGMGARRWLNLGFFRFQPSEFMKLIVPAMIAWLLSREPLPIRWSRFFICLVLILIPAALIVVEPDLGTALLVVFSGCFVIYYAGISWRLLAFLGTLLSALLVILLRFPELLDLVLKTYQKKRVLTFLNPENDPLGAGYHIIQSKIAIGSGGGYGKGWLNGTQSHLDFLPERHTDFIFSVIAEELGLLGIILLLIMYLFILMRCLYIASQAQDSYSALLAGAISLIFFVYIFVNIGMVSGLLPVVGVPLPLVSYGGTSAISIMMGFGFIMSIHTHRKLMAH